MTQSADSFRFIPSVDEVLRDETVEPLRSRLGERRLTGLVRDVLDEMRAMLSTGSSPIKSRVDARETVTRRIFELSRERDSNRLRRVINAAGVIVHTNLGRAPLSVSAIAAVADAAGYCTLEFENATGRRGRRGGRAEDLLVELTGAEAALVVNNCAAAAVLVLTAFAAGGEVVISRGELVEIGGGFRVPEVLAQSQARLKEVGTTNRTRPEDFAKALSFETAMILRVHPSNYRIVGFTSIPSLAETVGIAKSNGVMVCEDLGSGALVDFESYGVSGESTVQASVAAGADLVMFSGDKLLGGPQCGIIVGKRRFIDELRSHPLTRALRADKLAYAALEATLDAYARESAESEVPVIRMIAAGIEELDERAQKLVAVVQAALGDNSILEVVDGTSAIGGGAGPGMSLPTKLISVNHPRKSASKIETALRCSDPPVITRIVQDRVVIDLRTVDAEDEPELIAALVAVLA